MIVSGEGWGKGIVREFGMDMYKLLYLKWITNKDLRLAQGTLLNVVWQPGWERSLGENGYMYTKAESLYCSLEIITTLFISYMPI